MNDLKVLTVQPDVGWKDIKGNLSKFSVMLSELQWNPDLILFPEMFQTGFCTDPVDIAETMNGQTVRWMKRTAETYKCALAGSLVVKDGRQFFNRLVYIDQFENLSWYDKRHLFTIEGEELNYTPGRKRFIVPLNGWYINFQICYDLRFPVWARNRNDYDVLVNLANWPATRNDVWTTLLRARAIENQSFVIGVNRVGSDYNKIKYDGNSLVMDPKGNLVSSKSSEEGLLTATLSWEFLEKFRNDFPVWKDSDEFEITY